MLSSFDFLFGVNSMFLLFTAYPILFTIDSAFLNFPFEMNHLGLYGIFFLIKNKEKVPRIPKVKKYLQYSVSPMIILRIAANEAPKCHVPSIPILTLPLYLGGRNSSIAVNIAVNYPPTLI